MVSEGKYDPFDITRLDAGTATADRIMMTIGTPGLFASSRVIVLSGLGRKREAEVRAKAKPESTDVSGLEDLVRLTPESTMLWQFFPESVWIRRLRERLLDQGSRNDKPGLSDSQAEGHARVDRSSGSGDGP